VPKRILDVFTEFRKRTNGVPTISGTSLRGALTFHSLHGIGTVEKDEMRALVLRGQPWSPTERLRKRRRGTGEAIARDASHNRSAPRALPRPIHDRGGAHGAKRRAHSAALGRPTRRWHGIQDQLISDIDADYGVFDGRIFKANLFAAWILRADLPWPRRASGALDLSDDAFRKRASTPVAGFPVQNAASRPSRGPR
jgi:hypothetical protein